MEVIPHICGFTNELFFWAFLPREIKGIPLESLCQLLLVIELWTSHLVSLYQS